MLFHQFLVLNQYLLPECKCNDFFSIGIKLLINVVLFIPANIFNLATRYLSSRTGPTAVFEKLFQKSWRSVQNSYIKNLCNS